MQTILKIEGIYDTRTLKFLKSQGIKNYGFDFSPKSFNFIQEHVFLEQLIPILDTNDKITLSFSRSNDPMIAKVLLDLKKLGFDLSNAVIVCDEWTLAPEGSDYNYYIHYDPTLKLDLMVSSNFKGLIFSYNFFAGLHEQNLLNSFMSNFYTRYGKVMNQKETLMRVDWRDNVLPSLLDIFDVDQLIYSISDDIESCYRNVDLKKLESEMGLIKKKRSPFVKQDF